MAHSGKLGKKKKQWVSLVDPESNGKQSVTSTDERQRCALACENDEIEQNGEERWGGGVRERERERENILR